MSDDPTPTRVRRRDGRLTDFEEYMVRDGAPDDVAELDLSAAAAARPAPGVLEALERAEIVIVCPSNPLVSIGTILAVPGVRERLERRRCCGVGLADHRGRAGEGARPTACCGRSAPRSRRSGVARLYRAFVPRHGDRPARRGSARRSSRRSGSRCGSRRP